VLVAVVAVVLAAWQTVDPGGTPDRARAGSRPAQETPTVIVEPSPGPQETPTVIVEPSPVPRPIYLPRSLASYDPRVPEPLQTRGQGYLVKLTQAGRTACAPATHVLQDRPEGVVNARPWAVLHSPHPEPELNLDLYVGEYVEVFGFSSLTPDECRSLTWQILSVEALRRIVLPPGHGPTAR